MIDNMSSETFDLFPRAEVRGFIQHLRDRLYLFLFIFTTGFIVGYPLSEEIIELLLNADGFKPEGVQIIILQPMEVVLLKLRMSAQIGFMLLILTLIIDLALNGRNIIKDAKRTISDDKNINLIVIIGAIGTSIILGFIGLLYSHEILIPMLLEYLSQDASTAGLSSTWRLKSWIGFIVGLFFGSIVSFQTPLVSLLLLRTGVISRKSITENRGMIWFIAILLGAALSPPDPLSMFLVGGPIILLLEIALLVDKILRR